MLKPEIKQRWVEALRSGEYKKGKYQLKNSYGEFCCLGVLCDLHSKETGENWGIPNTPSTIFIEYLGECSTLPEEVMRWALNSYPCDSSIVTASVEINGRKGSLINHNDRTIGEPTFLEIADALDANF